MDVELLDAAKFLAAIAAGALIGLERELANKPAGLRTNILICVGAALFTVLSEKLAARGAVSDPARVAAQIVTGVGFLGAGAIIQHRRHVVGLTTAATIWVDASVGMAFGAGEFVVGALGTVLATGVLFGLGATESLIARWRSVGRFEVEFGADAHPRQLLDRLTADAGVKCTTWTINKMPEGLLARFRLVGPARQVEAVHQTLLEDEHVVALKRH